MSTSKNFNQLANAAQAMFPLVKLTLGFTVVALMTVFSLRQQGFKQEYTAPRHALFTPGFTFIAHQGGGGEAPPDTTAAFDHTLSLSSDIWLHVDVRQCADDLVIFPDERLEKITEGSGWIVEKPFGELSQLNAAYHASDEYRAQNLRILSLDQLLSRYPQAKFVLDIHSNLRDIHKRIVEIVEKHSADQRVLIQSEIDVILSATKELRPTWLYGTGARDLTRSHLLSSIWLESQAPLLGDIVLTPARIKGREVLHPRLVSEVHRREKKIFVAVDGPSELAQVFELHVDGVMTDRPHALWPLIPRNQ